MNNKLECKKTILKHLSVNRKYKCFSLTKEKELLDLVFYAKDEEDNTELFIYRGFTRSFFNNKKIGENIFKKWESSSSKYDKYFIEKIKHILKHYKIKEVNFSSAFTFDEALKGFHSYKIL